MVYVPYNHENILLYLVYHIHLYQHIWLVRQLRPYSLIDTSIEMHPFVLQNEWNGVSLANYCSDIKLSDKFSKMHKLWSNLSSHLRISTHVITSPTVNHAFILVYTKFFISVVRFITLIALASNIIFIMTWYDKVINSLKFSIW